MGGASGITGCWTGLNGLLHMHGAMKTEEPMSATDGRTVGRRHVTAEVRKSEGYFFNAS